MKYATIGITICLHLGFGFSSVVRQPCLQVEGGLCGKGQHVIYSQLADAACVECPGNTFVDFDSHVCESCKSHTQPSSREVVLRQGDSSSDSLIVCSQWFYRGRSPSKDNKAECEPCSVCSEDHWAARECNPENDTFCCLHGMHAVQKDGDLSCVPLRSVAERRKGRSGGTNGNDATSLGKVNQNNDSKADEIIDNKSEENSVPKYGYSRADVEKKRQMVEIPVWGRLLCAGIAVGIFVFFLGVGIPCNACGSLDKLKQLRRVVFSPNDTQPVDDESKEPIKLKSNSANA